MTLSSRQRPKSVDVDAGQNLERPDLFRCRKDEKRVPAGASGLDGKHLGMDYRTFSRRFTGDSKSLERLEGAVVRLISGIRDLPPGAKPREALRALGVEKFAPPVLISGPVDFGDASLGDGPRPYLGLPPGAVDGLRFRCEPAYLLTIENYASFNRHIAEADPQRSGATVYVGGYPSLGTQEALRKLSAKLSGDTPLFHCPTSTPTGHGYSGPSSAPSAGRYGPI